MNTFSPYYWDLPNIENVFLKKVKKQYNTETGIVLEYLVFKIKLKLNFLLISPIIIRKVRKQGIYVCSKSFSDFELYNYMCILNIIIIICSLIIILLIIY